MSNDEKRADSTTATTMTAWKKARRAHFRRLVQNTPGGKSLGFGRDRARKQLKEARRGK